MEMKKKGELGERGVSIDVVGEDVLRNIISRLPSSSFASAACVNRFWNRLCDSVLSIPKLASAHSRNPSLHEAVEEVFNEVFAELIRPHFAIVNVTSPDLHLARQLITEKLGSTIPVIYTAPLGLIGRDAITNEFKEIQWEVHSGKEEPRAYFFDEDDGPHPAIHNRVISLTVGFLPGIKVAAVPLLQVKKEVPSEDDFVTDIRRCVTSISSCTSPVGIMLFTDDMTDTDNLLEKLDHAMSLETVIVGDGNDMFLYGGDFINNIYERMNEHTGTVNIQFHVALSPGLSPISQTYKVTSVEEKHDGVTWGTTKLTSRREEFAGKLDEQTPSIHIYDDMGDHIHYPTFIGVVKKRECSIGLENAKWITSQIFREIQGVDQEYLSLIGHARGIKTGDLFRFFRPDSCMTLFSLSHVLDNFRDLKQDCDVGSYNRLTTTANGCKKIFGCVTFSCCTRGKPLGEANIASTPFLENFPGVTLAGSFSSVQICRIDSRSYGQVSEHDSCRCCVHQHSSVYLLMSYSLR